MDLYSDQLFFKRLQEGEYHAYKLMYEDTVSLLRAFAKKTTRNRCPTDELEDIITETYIAMFKTGPSVCSYQHYRRSLYVFCKNRCIDWFRLYRNDKRQLGKYLEYDICWLDDLREKAGEPKLKDDVIEKVHKHIKMLPERTRKAVMMAYVEGKTRREIVDIMGGAPQTINNLISEGVRVLQKYLLGKYKKRKNRPDNVVVNHDHHRIYDHEQIVKDKACGLTYHQIMKKHGCGSTSTIHSILKNANKIR